MADIDGSLSTTLLSPPFTLAATTYFPSLEKKDANVSLYY